MQLSHTDLCLEQANEGHMLSGLDNRHVQQNKLMQMLSGEAANVLPGFHDSCLMVQSLLFI